MYLAQITTLRASNEMIQGDFGIMILILRLWMEHYVKNFPLPPIQKIPRHKGVARQKRLLLAVKPADRQIRKRKVH